MSRHFERRGAARGLCLAAAPAFAAMACLTSVGGWQNMMICASAQEGSVLSGMTLMYVLMCLFHLPPWLELIERRRVAIKRETAPEPQPIIPDGELAPAFTSV